MAKTIRSQLRLLVKLAEENGINLASITGTGKGGRVTKEDVVAAVEAKKDAPAAAPAKAAALLPLLLCSLLATAPRSVFR